MNCASFNPDSTTQDLQRKKRAFVDHLLVSRKGLNSLHYNTKFLIIIFVCWRSQRVFSEIWTTEMWKIQTDINADTLVNMVQLQVRKGSSFWSVPFSRKLMQRILTELGKRRCELLPTLLVMVRPCWIRNMTKGLSSFWSEFTQSEQST